MATSSRSVDVDTGGARLDTAAKSPGPSGSSIAIYNPGPGTLYIGDEDVTEDDGYPIGPEQHYAEDLDPSEAVWGVSSDGTLDIRVREVGI